MGVIRTKGGELMTIGDFSIDGVPRVTTNGWAIPDPGVPLLQHTAGAVDPLKMWKQHPSLRKVVSFAAEQIGSIPWHLYQRVSDTDRRRAAESPAEKMLNAPSKYVTGSAFWRDIAIDDMLYDLWCFVNTGRELVRISPRLLDLRVTPLGQLAQIYIRDESPGGDYLRNVRTNEIIDWFDGPICLSYGWHSSRAGGVSPLITLANLLDEAGRAVVWRSSRWETEPKFTGYLTRPAGVWDPRKRERFVADWDKWKTLGQGTPILEDGMEYHDRDTSKIDPSKAQDLEGRKLTDEQVASAYHIAPELVGARPGNFSNMQAFRQMLFGPTLGPKLNHYQQAVNQMILATMDTSAGLYAELDRDAAINGSLMEQAEVLSKMTGGPVMTVAEARARLNLSYKAGTDEIITPMNVVRGGGDQASPEDAGEQNRDLTNPVPEKMLAKSVQRYVGVAMAKAAAKEAGTDMKQRDALQAAIAGVLDVMAESVTGKMDPDTFHARFDEVMAAALKDGLTAAALAGAVKVLSVHNPEHEGWAADVMDGYLSAMAGTTAFGINAGVVELVNEYEDDDDDEHTAAAALEVAKTSNAKAWAFTAITAAAAFGGHDAAEASGLKTKTWVTRSSNPRKSHARMDGETVAIGKNFSNGAKWPGDSSLDADETAGCTCGVDFDL